MNSMQQSGILGTLAVVAGLLLALPAGATSIFTVDGNGNGVNDMKKGADNVDFNFTGSLGLVSGSIRAVDLAKSSPGDLEAAVASFTDLSGGNIILDFDAMDVLVFDVVLDSGSAVVDEIGVAVGNSPITDPDGAGYLSGPGDSPDAVYLEPGIAGLFPGGVFYSYDKNGASSGNLEPGENSTRLFVTWSSGGPQTGQSAAFSLSSGINASVQTLLTDYFKPKGGGGGGGGNGNGKGRGGSASAQTAFSNAVPEPGVALLVGLGLAGLAMGRRGTSR